MKLHNRQAKIVEIIRRQERASVEDLARALDISRETVRRDLGQLARAGQIQKVHGGATLPPIFGEGSFQHRLSENVSAKIAIARAAAKRVRPGETLFVDTGSTTLYFAEKLERLRGLTVITNATSIARSITGAAGNNRCFLLGGEFSNDNNQTVGAMVCAQIAAFRAHHAVLTVAALDARTGAMDFNIEEAQIARAMIEQSESLTVLADHTKLEQIASFEVCPLARIDRLITNAEPPAPLRAALETAGTELLVAPG